MIRMQLITQDAAPMSAVGLATVTIEAADIELRYWAPQNHVFVAVTPRRIRTMTMTATPKRSHEPHCGD